MKKKNIVLAIGTRPEAIKLAPLYLELKNSEIFEPLIWATGQHNEMLIKTLSGFNISPDINLEVMTPGQTLTKITASILEKVEPLLLRTPPQFIIVQGDTTTALAMSLASFYHKIPLGHVEAGLRTDTKFSPYPEEMNRRLVSQIADFHFAPTLWSQNNLIKEGFNKDKILLSGNTVIDALSLTSKKVRISAPEISKDILSKINGQRKIILITGHRRENFGQGFEDLCAAIRTLAEDFKDYEFIYPVHLNPNVQEPVKRILSNLPNVLLTDPLDYEPFVYLMDKCHFIISDSGGIQEEAPHLGKPVLVMRESTERPEAIEAGTAKLVGTSQDSIVSNAKLLIQDQNVYSKMSSAQNPYGDGQASKRIREFLENPPPL